jgi:hypothetical protein
LVLVRVCTSSSSPCSTSTSSFYSATAAIAGQLRRLSPSFQHLLILNAYCPGYRATLQRMMLSRLAMLDWCDGAAL